MKKMTGVMVLIGVALFAAGCGAKSDVEAKGSIKDPVKADVVVETTTTTEAPVVTTTTEAPTTTTTAAPTQEMIWLDGMSDTGTKLKDANTILQLGDNDAVTCRKAMAIYNKIKIPAAPAKYALADKYEREAVTAMKTSMDFCIKGDLSYMLSYLQMGNEWLTLATNNLS